jgi:hypothetical protein
MLSFIFGLVSGTVRADAPFTLPKFESEHGDNDGRRWPRLTADGGEALLQFRDSDCHVF